MSGSATETIADYITGASFSDLPDEVVRKAKFWLLDSLGCGFGGAQSVLGQTAIRALAEISSGNAGVLGCSEKVSVGTSAFLNAMLVNALDYDDCSVAGHLSSTPGRNLAGDEGTDRCERTPFPAELCNGIRGRRPGGESRMADG